jgi:hypothetical protein
MDAIADQSLATDKNFPDLSIIVPCFNETDKLAACIGKARRALNEQKKQEKSWLPITKELVVSLYSGDQEINLRFN